MGVCAHTPPRPALPTPHADAVPAVERELGPGQGAAAVQGEHPPCSYGRDQGSGIGEAVGEVEYGGWASSAGPAQCRACSAAPPACWLPPSLAMAANQARAHARHQPLNPCSLTQLTRRTTNTKTPSAPPASATRPMAGAGVRARAAAGQTRTSCSARGGAHCPTRGGACRQPSEEPAALLPRPCAAQASGCRRRSQPTVYR